LDRFIDDVAVVGGCGRVGLPLALAFASRGLRVSIYDRDATAVAKVNDGIMPFNEPGAAPLLKEHCGTRLRASSDPAVVERAENITFVVGTPVDEYLNPDLGSVLEAVLGLADHFRAGQLLVLRSTVFPGVTARVEAELAARGIDVDVSFCPERIAEGRALTELFELPQIVSARNEEALERAAKLFDTLGVETVPLDPEEAELAKLFTNAYRYLKFAAANQLFRVANEHGLDYERIRSALTYDYPRAADLPKAGFAAGPCLLKDTMQLAAFNDNDFSLGHAAMMVNEGLPLYVAERMGRRWDLPRTRVGILGMAFKADSDDIRSSLSYKLRRILRFRARSVVCSDPFVEAADLLPLERVLEESDVVVVGAPHSCYARLATDLPVVDIWGIVHGGVRI
jgi:UDP-N-acetyl-D-mannosaminuronic acid dehydrogenase